MKYILSGFRTPKPGSLPELINGAVDFYKGQCEGTVFHSTQ